MLRFSNRAVRRQFQVSYPRYRAEILSRDSGYAFLASDIRKILDFTRESKRERERDYQIYRFALLAMYFPPYIPLYTCAFEKMKSASLAAHLFILDIHDIYEKYKNVEQRGQYASIDSLRAIIYEPLLILEIFVLDASMKRLSGRE